MKYIISENRLKESVWNYLDKNYGDLNSSCAFDDDGNEEWCGVEFYRDDYSDGDVVFRWYDKCWWHPESTLQAQENWEKSPIVAFDNESDYTALEGYFGDMWHDTFKEWFETSYGYKVESVE